MLYYGLYSLEHRDGPVKEKVLVGPLVTNFISARESTRPKYDTVARGDLEVVFFSVCLAKSHARSTILLHGNTSKWRFFCVFSEGAPPGPSNLIFDRRHLARSCG